MPGIPEKPPVVGAARADRDLVSSNVANASLLQRRQNSLGASVLFYEEPVHIVRGQGVWLFDSDGKRYLDCYNNVASVGHAHPQVVEALSNQAAILNTHTRYLGEQIVTYAERIAATMPDPLNVCMFVCSGTEANELAMRLARTVSGNNGAIVMENSYHGNSTLIGELSTCTYPSDRRPSYVAAIEPPNVYRGTIRAGEDNIGEKYASHVDSAIDKLRENGEGVAAFLCDMIFDTQGTLEAPEGYFKSVYEKVRASGGLCIADEVQPGFGRTGTNMWGFQNEGVVPDIVTLGKPMGAGHPVAAVVTTREIATKFAEQSFYFNTFGGNPVSAAVGLAVLDVIENEALQKNAQDVGLYLRQALEGLVGRHEIIGDVRGRGLFLGLELVRSRQTREPARAEALRVTDLMRANGVLLGATGRFGNVVKIRPPLVFSKSNADRLVEALDHVLNEVCRSGH